MRRRFEVKMSIEECLNRLAQCCDKSNRNAIITAEYFQVSMRFRKFGFYGSNIPRFFSGTLTSTADGVLVDCQIRADGLTTLLCIADLCLITQLTIRMIFWGENEWKFIMLSLLMLFFFILLRYSEMSENLDHFQAKLCAAAAKRSP